MTRTLLPPSTDVTHSLTSPRFSCQGLGLGLSSGSAASKHASPLTGLAVADASEGGAEEEKEGHSGAIMLAGIRAPTTASLSGGRGLVSRLPLRRTAAGAGGHRGRTPSFPQDTR